MEIRLGYELSFEVPRPTPMQLMLYVHPEQAPRLRQPERIAVEPATASPMLDPGSSLSWWLRITAL